MDLWQESITLESCKKVPPNDSKVEMETQQKRIESVKYCILNKSLTALLTRYRAKRLFWTTEKLWEKHFLKCEPLVNHISSNFGLFYFG